MRASYELRLGEERFSVEVDGEAITIARGIPRAPDAVIETDRRRCERWSLAIESSPERRSTSVATGS